MFKILVAEDDAELRQLFCRVLTRHGFQPIGAADGVEALQVLERDYIDLIVSDIMMPQLDGYALVRGLRDSGSTIPVLMITARQGRTTIWSSPSTSTSSCCASTPCCGARRWSRTGGRRLAQRHSNSTRSPF